MRILTRLKLLKVVIPLSLAVLGGVMIGSLLEFSNARDANQLASAIQNHAAEAASLRDQYFLYRTEHTREAWLSLHQEGAQLLAQAHERFSTPDERQLVAQLVHKQTERLALFQRIVANTRSLSEAGPNRFLYEELDKRLLNQLLVRAATFRNLAMVLQRSSQQRADDALRQGVWNLAGGTVALALLIMTVLFSTDRLINQRLAALHTGARAVANGRVDLRIDVPGTDELADLADSINTMTEALLRQAARQQEEARLRESAAHFRQFFEGNSSVMLLTEPVSGQIVNANPAAATYYGTPLNQLIGMNIAQINTLPPEAIARERAAALHEERNFFNFQHRLANGEVRDVEVYATPTEVADQVLLFSIIHDISARKQAEQQLQLAANVFSHAHEGILITDPNGMIIEVNDTFTQITGYPREEALGHSLWLMSSGLHPPAFFAELWNKLLASGHWYGEIWNRHKQGRVYAVLLTISRVCDAQGHPLHYVGLFSDITALKEHERQLEHLAHYDALTGLPNGVLLADRVRQAMTQAQRHAQSIVVAFLDLDGFKAVNDHYGHAVGDRLLMVVATRMKEALREGDTLARVGGDEFVAVLLDLVDIAVGEPIFQRLLAAASQPVMIGDHALQVSASIGITFYPQADEIDAEQLLRQADQAMYQAKLAGKNGYYAFDAVQDRSIPHHYQTLARIHEALSAHELVLYYQPKVNMRTGTVIGAEALIRWQHPQEGLLPPAQFMPVVNASQLESPVGSWMISEAVRQMSAWAAQGLSLPVSVNVAARHLLQPAFVADLRTLLARYPAVPPAQLELEILESVAFDDIATVSRLIEGCGQLGVHFALDDFGTGYASLTNLRHLTVRVLKIDQSFVQDLLVDPEAQAIVQGVVGLAAAFQRSVIAEGVETTELGCRLLELGCDWAQGYGIARPMPPEQIPDWIAGWTPPAAWGAKTTGSRSSE